LLFETNCRLKHRQALTTPIKKIKKFVVGVCIVKRGSERTTRTSPHSMQALQADKWRKTFSMFEATSFCRVTHQNSSELKHFSSLSTALLHQQYSVHKQSSTASLRFNRVRSTSRTQKKFPELISAFSGHQKEGVSHLSPYCSTDILQFLVFDEAYYFASCAFASRCVWTSSCQLISPGWCDGCLA
jgi:hypothetical protein